MDMRGRLEQRGLTGKVKDFLDLSIFIHLFGTYRVPGIVIEHWQCSAKHNKHDHFSRG